VLGNIGKRRIKEERIERAKEVKLNNLEVKKSQEVKE
jgi:hypothetical protein